MKVLDHLELVCARTKEPVQKPTSCEGLPLTHNESDEDAPSEPSKHSDDSSEEGGEARNNTHGETGVEDLEPGEEEPKPKVPYPPSDSRYCGLLPAGLHEEFLCTPARMSGRSAEATYAQDFVNQNPLIQYAASSEQESPPALAPEQPRCELEPGEAEHRATEQQRFFTDLDKFVLQAEDRLESAAAAGRGQLEGDADEASGGTPHSRSELSDALHDFRKGLCTNAMHTHTSVFDAFAFLVRRSVLNVKGSLGKRGTHPEI